MAIFGASAAGAAFRPGESAATSRAGRSHPADPDIAGARHLARAAGTDARRTRILPDGRRRRARRCPIRGGRTNYTTGSAAGSGFGIGPRRGARAERYRPDIAAILYTSGSTGKPKGVVLSHRNLMVGAESVSMYLGIRRRRDPRRAALSSTPVQPADDRLRGGCACGPDELPSPRRCGAALCAAWVTGLTCVPPLWIQIAEQEWPADRERCAISPTPAARCPSRPWTGCESLSVGETVPHVRADRGIPLHLPRSGRDRPPAGLHRQGDSGRRNPGGPARRRRCDPGEEGELVHRGARRAGYWNDPSDRGAVPACPRSRASGARPKWRSGRATPWSPTRRASSTSSGAGRDDQDSGYRVSPTEIEEVAYATGSCSRCGSARCGGRSSGNTSVVSPARRAGQRRDDRPMKRKLPLYMVPSASSFATRFRGRRTASSTGRAA